MQFERFTNTSLYYDYIIFGQTNNLFQQKNQVIPDSQQNTTTIAQNYSKIKQQENEVALNKISEPSLPIFDYLFNWYSLVFIITVLVIYLIFCRKKKSNKGSKLYIVGESGSGKTALIYRLCTQQIPLTYSSLQQNESVFQLEIHGKQVQIPIIDNPGHHPMRQNIYQNIENAKAIILLIDSCDNNNMQNSTDLLYQILIQKNYVQYQPEILIACNKQDHPEAKSQSEIEQEIIKEMERLKFSRRAVADDNEEIDDYLKLEESKFNFEEKSIQIFSCSVKDNNGIEQVVKFIKKAFA